MLAKVFKTLSADAPGSRRPVEPAQAIPTASPCGASGPVRGSLLLGSLYHVASGAQILSNCEGRQLGILHVLCQVL